MVVVSEPVTGTRSIPATCGNGVVDPGEQCDDGTNLPPSCCNSGCQFVAEGTSCGPTSCTAHTCDGAGTCMTVMAPAASCRAPTAAGAAQLTLKTAHSRSSLKWKWAKGQATALADFGDPLHADKYSLCLYDLQAASTLLDATVSPGTNWRAKGQKGFTYKDKLGVPDGVTTVVLGAGDAGKAKIVVGAKGPNLPFPAGLLGVPSIPPLVVQLRGHGECWGAGYVQAGVKRNTATKLVATSSPSEAFLDGFEAHF
jgi:cysteine-rich repeat protein